jgi:hypothetical protein
VIKSLENKIKKIFLVSSLPERIKLVFSRPPAQMVGQEPVTVAKLKRLFWVVSFMDILYGPSNANYKEKLLRVFLT